MEATKTQTADANWLHDGDDAGRLQGTRILEEKKEQELA